MSLNVTFTCNSIVDENESAIDCNYKAYYVRQGVWNKTRTSDQSQFCFNAGDDDSLSQTGELKTNDVIIICLWQDELNDDGSTSDSTSGIKTRFATFSIVHDGTKVYVIDPQLKPKMAPTCDWEFNQSQIINESYTAIPLSDDEDSWTYSNHTFYHRRNYYSTLIFDSVGNITDTYDYDNSGTFVSDTSNSYDSIADITATHKAVNSYGLESTCSKTVRTYYHKPVPEIVFTPNMTIDDVFYGDDLTVDFKVFNNDVDSRTSSFDYELRYVANDDSYTVDNKNTGSTSDVSVVKTIDQLSRIRAFMTIKWNDGWNDQSFNHSEIRTVKNTLPTTNLSITNLTARQKRFQHLSNDVDGNIVYANYKIYLLMPFGAGWTLVQEATNTDSQVDDPVEVTFAQNGTYKAVLSVRDDANTRIPSNYGTATDEIEFDISIDTCTAESYEAAKIEEIRFIFSDTFN